MISNRTIFRKFILAAAVCPAALLASTTFAQTADKASTASAAKDVTANEAPIGAVPETEAPNAPGPQEIIVTAMRRSQTMISVPATVSALDESAIQERGINTLDAIQQQTPGMSFGTALGTTQVSIRGVGLTIATGAGEPGVAVHLDGVYEARPALSGMAAFDLQRIEVVKGPQGTLYGRNATGGAINFISNPATSTFEATAKIGYAEYNELHMEMIASGPVNDKIRARFGVTFTNRADGFLYNINPGQLDANEIQNLGARGKIEFDLSDSVNLVLQLTYLQESGTPVYLTPSQPLDPQTVAFNPALQGALVSISPTSTAIQSSELDRTAYSPVATLNWDFGSTNLTSITAYSHISNTQLTDADGTSAQMGILPNGYTSDQFTQEFDLRGKTGSLDWVAGLYYLNENYKAYQDVSFPNGFTLPFFIPGLGYIPIPVYAPGSYLVQHWSEDRQGLAAFADGTYHITDRLSVFAGGRISNDRLTLTQTNGTLPAAMQCTDLTNTVKFTAFTPRAGVQFEPNDGGNLYGSVSRGYKSGGMNFGTCNDPYEPETLTAFEIGYKTRLASNTISLAVAAFYYDYRDLQVYQLKPITQGGGTFIDNAPKATIKGIEGDFTWNPTQSLQFNANVAFLDAKYDEYSNTDSSVIGSGPIDLSGVRLTKSPQFQGNIGAQYTTGDFGNVGHFIFRGEVYHSSSQSFTEFHKPQDIQGAYTVLNAFATLESVNNVYSFRLYAKNFTNEHYFNFVTASPLSGTTLVTYAPPRQIGAELIFNF